MLKIEARIEGARIVVLVTVRNGYSEVLYLQNWLFDWYGLLGVPELNAGTNNDALPTRELAYTAHGGPGEMVLLSGDGPGPPIGVSVFAPRLPYATRLRSGETYTGRIYVPLPVREWHAYKSPQLQPTRPVRVRSIRYRLEAVLASRCDEPVEEHPSFKGAFIVSYPPSEVLEATTLLPTDVELLERTDKFQRF